MDPIADHGGLTVHGPLTYLGRVSDTTRNLLRRMPHAPARTVICAALVAAFLTLFGAVETALAHFGHDQKPVASTSLQNQPSSVGVEETVRACTNDASARIGEGSAPPIAPMGLQSCCGSLTCHAALEETVSAAWVPQRFGERLRVPRFAAQPGRNNSGLERPPRRS